MMSFLTKKWTQKRVHRNESIFYLETLLDCPKRIHMSLLRILRVTKKKRYAYKKKRVYFIMVTMKFGLKVK